MTVSALHQRRIPYSFDFMVACGIDASRSKMATNVLRDKNFTHLLFIDDDMAWSADLPIRLMQAEVDIIGVPYRKKKSSETVFNIKHSEKVEYLEGHPSIISVDGLGTGMILIKREVFETLENIVPLCIDSQMGDYRMFFHHTFIPVGDKQSYVSEDYAFCVLAKANGFKIWAYTDEEIAHIGPYAFTGNYAKTTASGATDNQNKSPLRLLLN